MEKIPITIVGGGVIGLAIAWELSKSGWGGVFLFEKNPYLGDEQSGRNSCVLHAGIYYPENSLKAKLCVSGNRMIYDFCREYGVACVNTKKIIVAINDEEDKKIDFYLQRATANGVVGVKKIYRDEIKKIEPNVEAVSALYVPSTGILDVPEYVKALAKLAKDSGAEIIKESKIVKIEPQKNTFIAHVENLRGGTDVFETDILINAAGLYSDEIASMINPNNPYRIIPLRGEYYRYDSSKREEIKLNGMNVYQVQEPYYIDGKMYLGIGIHLTPTLELKGDKKVIGRYVSVGPTSIPVKDKHDYESERRGPEYFYEDVVKFFPNIKIEDLEIDYAGNRAKLKDYDDFVIKRDDAHSNCIHLIGIDSPGLTSSLSIAGYVRENFFK